MEAPEVPIEHVQEHLHHHAHNSKVSWNTWVALSSAILATLAAVSSLKAGHYANEAMVAQIKSANQWSYYQSKSIKNSQLTGKMELLAALGKPAEPKDNVKADEYKHDMEQIKDKAEELGKESTALLHKHEILAKSVTMFQVAISVAAIAVLAHRRAFWYVGLGFGAIGAWFLAQGLMSH